MIPCVYSLSRYFWDFFRKLLVRLVYTGLDFHISSSGVSLMGNLRFAGVTWISYSFSTRKKVLAMGDLAHACCLSLGRCNESLYLVDIYLARPW